MARELHVSDHAFPLTDVGLGDDTFARLVGPGDIPRFFMGDKTYCPPEFYVQSTGSLEDAKQELVTMLQVAGLLVSDTTKERAQVVFFSRGGFMSRPTSRDGSAPRKSGEQMFHWMIVSLSVVIGDEVYMTKDGRNYLLVHDKLLPEVNGTSESKASRGIDRATIEKVVEVIESMRMDGIWSAYSGYTEKLDLIDQAKARIIERVSSMI